MPVLLLRKTEVVQLEDGTKSPKLQKLHQEDKSETLSDTPLIDFLGRKIDPGNEMGPSFLYRNEKRTSLGDILDSYTETDRKKTMSRKSETSKNEKVIHLTIP